MDEKLKKRIEFVRKIEGGTNTGIPKKRGEHWGEVFDAPRSPILALMWPVLSPMTRRARVAQA